MNKTFFIQQMLFRFMPGDPDMVGSNPIDFCEHYWVKHQIAEQYKPKSIVEIGVHGAYGAWALIMGAKAMSYIGIDPYFPMTDVSWGGMQDRFHKWAEVLVSSTKIPHFEIRVEDSQKINTVPVADFYHVDGDHTYLGCLHDLAMCFASVPVGKQILVDDYDFIPPVRQAIENFYRDRKDCVSFEYRKSLRGEAIFTKTREPGPEVSCAIP